MSTLRDLDRLALALPDAQCEVRDGRPVYSVRGKMFCFHRSPRPDALDETGARLEDVLGFRVADEGMKGMWLADDRGVFFTTPHFNGYPMVLLRIRDLGQVAVDELDELVTDAWLVRAPKRLASAWLTDHGLAST